MPDYSGATKEEREQRIDDIIDIAHRHGYNAIFAGYGFMAEDEQMVAAMEGAGLNFIGPCSRTVRQAGLKDEAKRTALKSGISHAGYRQRHHIDPAQEVPGCRHYPRWCPSKRLRLTLKC